MRGRLPGHRGPEKEAAANALAPHCRLPPTSFVDSSRTVVNRASGLSACLRYSTLRLPSSSCISHLIARQCLLSPLSLSHGAQVHAIIPKTTLLVLCCCFRVYIREGHRQVSRRKVLRPFLAPSSSLDTLKCSRWGLGDIYICRAAGTSCDQGMRTPAECFFFVFHFLGALNHF